MKWSILTAAPLCLFVGCSPLRTASASLLSRAAAGGNVLLAQICVHTGADLNAPGPDGRSPLHTALVRHQEVVARMLIAHGANVNELVNGSTPLLRVALDHNQLNAANLMMDAGADLARRDSVGRSELHRAVQGRDFSKAVLILGHAPSTVELHDTAGVTPLHIAAADGDTNMVRLLLVNRARVNAADHRGVTPLMAATGQGRAAVICMLAAAGADAGLRDSAGRTAMDYAPRAHPAAIAAKQ